MLPIIFTINNEDDRNFVEKIYIEYGKRIYKIAFEILNNAEDAEDCLHDVINIIIDHLDMFRALEQEHLVKLIVTSARNAAIDIYRRNKATHIKEGKQRPYTYIEDEYDDMNEMENIPDDGESSDVILINDENQKRISKIIEELDPIYRDVLLLRYRYSMKNQDIAKALRLSESVVKVRYHRAKKILLQKRGRELNEIRKNG